MYLPRILARDGRVILAAVAILVVLTASALAGSVDPKDVPENKRTTLGLYATPAEAYAAWEAAPDDVTILDVRSPEEFMLVGHPTMAWNVPVKVQTLEWNAEGEYFAMKPNPGFVDAVKEILDPSDTVYVLCRSGGRSARAVDLLAEAGFTNAWSIVEGMEGDKVNDEASPDYGHRTINGWKNSGLPWTYELNPKQIGRTR